MTIFGYKIIRADEYDQLKRHSVKWNKTIRVMAWFSGWDDLKIIWKYIAEDTNYGGIERARSDYAEARGTDEYGRKENES